MAKPFKNALPVCLILTLIALIGCLLAFFFKLPLLSALFILPAAVYEVYRAEGILTKAASGIYTVIMLVLSVMIIFSLDLKLDGLLQLANLSAGKLLAPFAALSTVLVLAAAALGVFIFLKTGGVFTRWLGIDLALAGLFQFFIMRRELFIEIIRNIGKEFR